MTVLIPHVEIPTTTLVAPAGMTVGHGELHAFAVTVEWRGPRTDTGRGLELSRAGNWAHPDRFQQHQYRWATRTEALIMAHQHVDAVTFNGRTWAEWQKHIAQRATADS